MAEPRRAFLGRTVKGVGVGALLVLTGPRFARKLVTDRSSGSVTVAVGWSGGELRRFRELMDSYERHADVQVDVEPVGDEIDAYLEAWSGTDRFPDVALLPRPGLMREYVDNEWLEPLDDLAGRFPPAWLDLVSVGGQVYGAWVKAAHKSLFWYDASRFGADPAGWRWADLVDWVSREADVGGRPPLAIGAGDGWVLTDWLENLLALFGDQELYRRLARGEACWASEEAVEQSFRELADLWRIPNAIAGGRRAVLMEFDESVAVAATGEATAVLGPDFALNAHREIAQPSRRGIRLQWFRFPARSHDREGRVDPQTRRLVVGGDFAVVRRGSRQGVELVNWLTDRDAVRQWISEPGYLTPNTEVTPDEFPGDAVESFARELASAGPDRLRFDLSDQLPGALNGADGRGSWAILTDFFREVTEPYPDVDRAVRRAIGRFDRAASRRCSA